MSYREAPPGVPLITCFGGHLCALDAERGTKLWTQNVGELAVLRVIVAERSVFVATPGADSNASRILVFDLLTGAPRGAVDVPFRILTALAQGDRVYFGGSRGIIGMRADGTLLFKGVPERVASSAWSGNTYDLVMKDAMGRDAWRLSEVGAQQSDGLLVLGDVAAQPDFNS